MNPHGNGAPSPDWLSAEACALCPATLLLDARIAEGAEISVEERGPSMALVSSWRGERGTLLMPVQRVKADDAASLYELVHIYAPNGNRFLAEGLAVYAHERSRGSAPIRTMAAISMKWRRPPRQI